MTDYWEEHNALRAKVVKALELPKTMFLLSRHWAKTPTTFSVGDTIYQQMNKFKEARKMHDEAAKVAGFGPDNSLGIYKVYFFYGGKGKGVFEWKVIIANNYKDAKVKSGFYNYIKPDWDGRYLTFFAECIRNVQREE